MMFFIELQCFDRETLTKLRWMMLADSTDDVRWFEWTANLDPICQPDLTLIGPQHMSWIELAKSANSAAGRQVVLVGEYQFALGLQTIPLDFAMHQLLAFMPWRTQGRIQQSAVVETPSRGRRLDYKCTIPVGVS